MLYWGTWLKFFMQRGLIAEGLEEILESISVS